DRFHSRGALGARRAWGAVRDGQILPDRLWQRPGLHAEGTGQGRGNPPPVRLIPTFTDGRGGFAPPTPDPAPVCRPRRARDGTDRGNAWRRSTPSTGLATSAGGPRA